MQNNPPTCIPWKPRSKSIEIILSYVHLSPNMNIIYMCIYIYPYVSIYIYIYYVYIYIYRYMYTMYTMYCPNRVATRCLIPRSHGPNFLCLSIQEQCEIIPLWFSCTGWLIGFPILHSDIHIYMCIYTYIHIYIYIYIRTCIYISIG